MRRALAIAVVAVLAAPAAASACEPILPLFQLFAGSSTVLGTSFYTKSVVALGVVVLLKSLLFAVFEKRLPWHHTFLAMILANVASTVIGVALALATSVPIWILPSLLLVFAVSKMPANRLVQFNPWGKFKGRNPSLISLLITFFYFLTFVLFTAAMGVQNASGGSSTYWMMKLAYIYVGLGVSIFLTSAWEEAVVGWTAAENIEKPYFLPTVLRANAYTLLLVFGYAAIEVIPRRLASPDFLILLKPF